MTSAASSSALRPRRQRCRPAPAADATMSSNAARSLPALSTTRATCSSVTLVRGLADLPGQIVVGCLQGRAADRPLRHRLAKGRTGLSWALQDAPLHDIGRGAVIWVDGVLALPERVAPCEQPLGGAIEVPVPRNLVVEGIRAAADDVEQAATAIASPRAWGVTP